MEKSDAGGRLYSLYDGAAPVAELDSNGNLQALNTFGAGGLVSRHTIAANASVFSAFDERGNVVTNKNSRRTSYFRSGGCLLASVFLLLSSCF